MDTYEDRLKRAAAIVAAPAKEMAAVGHQISRCENDALVEIYMISIVIIYKAHTCTDLTGIQISGDVPPCVHCQRLDIFISVVMPNSKMKPIRKYGTFLFESIDDLTFKFRVGGNYGINPVSYLRHNLQKTSYFTPLKL
ncbi:hypothetical protein [Asticcacaulis tiandongensis]|uniref:hypothetical protein n=1 Tax=Asticcacaulis tiandongensis TaxID=2565365 RepID=UPI001125E3D2|nr:hypothetical protein [Asticcacaulis tiandongensis]